ncbi:MAG TPA: 1-phosphofructokinase family hexose kinase [Streptosporangiaceae bacterium]|nr:1-phosphofructokinase family hexose kinase [Streptosporangiaceae bacterium]
MILVVALNPALDVTHQLSHVDWAGVNRPDAVHEQPGGKGLNVARVLHAGGSDVLLAGLAGGHTGNELKAALGAAHVPAVFADIAGETRRTFAIVDSERAQTAMFNEPGPVVSEAEYAAFAALFGEALPRSSAVVLSGSLPPGLPARTYARLITMAAEAGVPTLLDASGDPLRFGVAAGPAIVKPNLAELEVIAGQPLPGDCAVVAAAADLRAFGADAVVVTLGTDGLLAVTGEGSWHARPEPVAGNPTGAGDAAAAALVHGLVEGTPWPDRVRHAAALGAAAVAAQVAGEYAPADYERALASVRVTSWEQSSCH